MPRRFTQSTPSPQRALPTTLPPAKETQGERRDLSEDQDKLSKAERDRRCNGTTLGGERCKSTFTTDGWCRSHRPPA
jgi:hypothetical protein